MTDQEIITLLQNAGFNSGWVVSGGELCIWEHEENPPSPLTRPVQEAPEE